VRFLSLRLKFVIYFVGFMTASLALLAKSQFDHEHDALLQEMRKRLAVGATNLGIQSREAMETGDDLSILTTLRGRRGNEDFAYGAVLQNDGTVFAHSDVRQVGRRLKIPAAARELREGYAYRTLRDDGDSHIEVWAPVQSSLGGTTERIGLVCLAVSEEPLLLQIQSAKISAMRVGALFILLGILGTAFIARTVTKPIGQLVQGVKRIASGDLDHKMRMRRSDEIGLLSDSFDHMTDELQQAQHELLKQHLYEKELEVAGKIQASLLPHGAPRLENASVAALSVPARVVGGDFYDYIQLDDGRTAFLVADVAGKGVSAGLVMTSVRSAARSVFTYTTSPRKALVALNEQMLNDFHRSTFVTMLIMVLDASGRWLRIANAGHPAIVWVRAAVGDADPVQLRGAAVGVLPSEQFAEVLEETELELEPGDLVLGYSDGVNEAHDRDANLYGEERLHRFAEHNANLEPQEFLDRLHEELGRFSQGFGQFDDITAVALKCTLERAREPQAELVGAGPTRSGHPGARG
jgi:sigma-B regulation protein RsbU (phosphoserine phosphatase)